MKWLIFFVFISISLFRSELKATETEKINISCCFSDRELQPGRVVTGSVIIKNNTESPLTVTGQIHLPEGWTLIPLGAPSFSVPAGEEDLQLVAIKVPEKSPAGSYVIHYRACDASTSAIISQTKFCVAVRAMQEIQTFLEEPPKQLFAGASYEIFLRVINTGNTAVTATISTMDCMDYCCGISPASVVVLDPYEDKYVAIHVQTDPLIKTCLKHVVQVRVMCEGDEENIHTHTSVVDIFPSTYEPFDPFYYFPMQATFAAGLGDGKAQVFTEITGEAPLNEDETAFLEFSARVPVVAQTNVVNTLYGVPEKNFLHYYDDYVDAYAGDGIFSLSPLTLLYCYGRGGALNLSYGNIEVGGVSVKELSSISEKNFGGFVSFYPRQDVALTASAIKRVLSNQSERLLWQPKVSSSYSLSSSVDHPILGEIFAEFAATGAFPARRHNRQAYYLNACGNPCEGWWYGLQKIYGGPQFTGYYSDMKQTNASLGFPIIGRLRGYAAYNLYETNLSEFYEKMHATSDEACWGGLLLYI